MRVTRTVSNLDGTNQSPAAGDFITDTNRDFITRGVVTGVSVLTNKSNGNSAVVGAVSATRIDASGTRFQPGDFYSVTLNTAWTVQNSDQPVIDIECKRCGFSYPNTELIQGRCKWCVDKPRPT